MNYIFSSCIKFIPRLVNAHTRSHAAGDEVWKSLQTHIACMVVGGKESLCLFSK